MEMEDTEDGAPEDHEVKSGKKFIVPMSVINKLCDGDKEMICDVCEEYEENSRKSFDEVDEEVFERLKKN